MRNGHVKEFFGNTELPKTEQSILRSWGMFWSFGSRFTDLSEKHKREYRLNCRKATTGCLEAVQKHSEVKEIILDMTWTAFMSGVCYSHGTEAEYLIHLRTLKDSLTKIRKELKNES